MVLIIPMPLVPPQQNCAAPCSGRGCQPRKLSPVVGMLTVCYKAAHMDILMNRITVARKTIAKLY